MNKEEEEEFKNRIWNLLQSIYKLVDESRFDPILETFKNNEILHEFFMQRILELISNIFDNEKELYIQKLLLEKSEFQNNFLETQKNYEEVKIKLIYFQLNKKLNNLEEIIKKSKIKEEENLIIYKSQQEELNKNIFRKDEKIKNLNSQIEFQEKEFNDLFSKFSDMNKDFDDFQLIHDRAENENILLQNKNKSLEDEGQSLNKRFNELNLINLKYEEENNNLSKQLVKFREDYENLKAETEKNTGDSNKLIEENFSFKIKLEDKNKLMNEILEKYENLKKSDEEKTKKYQNVNFLNKIQEIEILNKKISILDESIKNTYKVKNSALKNKLKEKLELLERNNNEFDSYKKDKEKLIAKMISNHQEIINEKNKIIEEMIKKKQDKFY